jgi:hypothetical protein
MRLAVAVAALCGALQLKASFADGGAVMANVPFAFTVGNESMPAGRYTISAASGVVWMRDVSQHAAVNILTIPMTPKKERATGALLFYKYGDRYFLREMWAPGYSAGAQVPKGKIERELFVSALPERVHVAVVAAK